MAQVTNILAQLAPAATTETVLYTVQRDGHALIQELVVCNRSGGLARVRVSISIRGAATATSDFLFYDLPVEGNDTFAAELGLTIGAGDVIRVYCSTATVTFTLLGAKT